jgi:hypothetical protein
MLERSPQTGRQRWVVRERNRVTWQVPQGLARQRAARRPREARPFGKERRNLAAPRPAGIRAPTEWVAAARSRAVASRPRYQRRFAARPSRHHRS